MSPAFDPYHRWLGIRPEEQPADHYRLLGLVRFEDDLEVIRDAAERQMGHVRHYALGQHRDLSQKILNELGAARACLLVPAKKVRYDAELRAAAAGPLPPEPPPAETVDDWESTFVPVAPRIGPPKRAAPGHRKVKPTGQKRETKTNRLQITPKHLLIGGIVAGVVVLVGSVLAVFFSGPGGGTQKGRVVATKDAKSTATPPPPDPAVAPFDSAEAKRHQEAWAKHLGMQVEITNSIGMKLRLIPAGEFQMGSAADEKERESSEGPVHRVRITKPFYLGVYEVTQAEYEQVMGTNPSTFKGERLPVEQVSWDDAMAYCRKLSEKEGQEYRLPTEAEWEYACRAGSTTRYAFGDSESELDKYAWYGSDPGGKTHPVGEKQPNGWGLHDMHGNVWEWCRDTYGDTVPGGADPLVESESSPARVFRGGGWRDGAGDCQSANRYRDSPGIRGIILGFRLAVVWSGR